MKATSTLCGKELTELDPDVMDAIGELTNIVIGSAKKYLTDFTMNISLPTVIKGDRLVNKEPPNVFAFIVPFKTKFGGSDLGVGLKLDL